MPAVSPAHGPVAVTGASGYIGSCIVQDLVQQGYKVRACVRDRNKPLKIDHLLAMNNMGLRGNVELREGDLFEPGSYDAPFSDCCAVIHTGAPQGYNNETAQQTYDGCFTATHHVLDSVLKAGSVKRVVFTSSFAAVTYPCEEGYVFTEQDWADEHVEAFGGMWNKNYIPTHRHIAYKMAKCGSERMLYKAAEEDGRFEAMGILPAYVIGPVMCANHDQRESFQNWIKRMLQGNQYGKAANGRMQWTICDVRDVAKSHRLCIESTRSGNGSRYINGPVDVDGVLFTWQLQKKMQALLPHIRNIGGEEMIDGHPAEPTPDKQRTFGLLAKQELGLTPYPVEDTIRDTADSYFRIGLLP